MLEIDSHPNLNSLEDSSGSGVEKHAKYAWYKIKFNCLPSLLHATKTVAKGHETIAKRIHG